MLTCVVSEDLPSVTTAVLELSPQSRRGVNHTCHVQEQAGSQSTFPTVKKSAGILLILIFLQNTPQGSSSGQDWETLC